MILMVLMVLLLLVLIIPAIVFSPYGGVNIINDDRVGEYSTTFNNDKLMENPDNLLSLSPIDLINLGYYYEMTELIYNVFTYYTFTFSDDSYTDIFIRYSDN